VSLIEKWVVLLAVLLHSRLACLAALGRSS
jgi:hypothetical protein